MDKYRHTDDNHEFDDVSQLILELKDLTVMDTAGTARSLAEWEEGKAGELSVTF